MPRPFEPSRRAELLDRILDHLLDKPLATLSLRTLAAGLGVSTYTLVYQFGSKRELMREIVRAISSRSDLIEERLGADSIEVDDYFHGLELSWRWSVEPRNRQLQRLEFEAGLLEAIDPNAHTFTRELFDRWTRIGREALLRFGLTESQAETESRIIVDLFHGIQYDLILNGDEARASAAFVQAMELHRDRIESLRRA